MMYDSPEFPFILAVVAVVINLPVVLVAYIRIKLLKKALGEMVAGKKYTAKSLEDASALLSRSAASKPMFGEVHLPLRTMVEAIEHLRAFGYLSEHWAWETCKAVKSTIGSVSLQCQWANRHYLLRINDATQEVGAYLPFGGVPASSIPNSAPPPSPSFEVHLTGVHGFSVVPSEAEAKKRIEEHAQTLRIKATFANRTG